MVDVLTASGQWLQINCLLGSGWCASQYIDWFRTNLQVPAIGVGKCTADAVSYTHLDVYKRQGAASVAITDHGSMYGVVDFYKAAKAKGIHPIIGCEVYEIGRAHV